MRKFYVSCYNILIIAVLFIVSNTNNIAYANKFNVSTNKFENQSIQGLPKEVFLTFDDGPSVNNTEKILNDSNIKGTFFVVGIKAAENPEILKELSNNGMCIGVHSYSHNYKKIYKGLDSYINDYEMCRNVIKNITNKNPINYTRLPGGSTNL